MRGLVIIPQKPVELTTALMLCTEASRIEFALSRRSLLREFATLEKSGGTKTQLRARLLFYERFHLKIVYLGCA